MAWHLLEKLIEHSAAHSTLLGKWWIAFMFVFRIIVIASVGDSVYSDEQDQFTCNTKQPGCKQVCYNKFAPISHIRFWAFQILATGTPTVIFVIYTMHKLAQIPVKPEGDDATKETAIQTPWKYAKNKKSETKEVEKRNDEKMEGKKSNKSIASGDYMSPHNGAVMPTKGPMDKVCRENIVRKVKRKIVRLYACNLILRTVVEVTFVYFQYYMYQWSVPEFYECIRYPCPKIVECYVSRPMEKTIFLYFMFIVGIICILLNILEMKYLGYRKLKRIFLPIRRERFVPPSAIEGVYPPRTERVVMIRPRHAPPGYYIPDVDPPSERYRSPKSGFPPIRVAAESFTTSESDLTSLNDSIESRPIIYRH